MRDELLAVAGTSGHYRPTAENIALMKEWLAKNGVIIKDVHWFGHSITPFSYLKHVSREKSISTMENISN